METSASKHAISSEISLRQFKRPKFYRKRGQAEDPATIDDNQPGMNEDDDIAKPLTIEELISQHGHHQDIGEQTEDAAPLPIAQILRQHKAAQRRRGGIEFTNSSNTRLASSAAEPSDALIEKDDTIQEIKTVVDRFAPQTGQVADVNKHM